MPDLQHPASSLLLPGRHGTPGPGPVRIAAIRRDIVQVAVRKGRAEDLARLFREAFGRDLPAPGRSATAGGLTALPIQPGAWLIVASPLGEGTLARRLREAGRDASTTVDQSHGRCVLSLAGARARDVLARLCRVDFHPSVFGPGRVAVTPVSDLPCVILQSDSEPCFEIIVVTTFVGSFVHALTDAAATFGYEIASQ